MRPWVELRGTLAAGVVLIAILVLLALLAPWIAEDPNQQIDPANSALRRPLTRLELVRVDDSELAEIHAAEEVRVADDRVTVVRRRDTRTYDRSAVELLGGQRHLLGTDRLGRDLWARVVWGARTSLLIGAAAALVALTVGLLVGAVAALGGSLVDQALMRAVDAFLAFPQLLLVLLLGLLFPAGPLTLVLIVGGTSWMGLSRLVRAELLSLRSRPFVEAARGLGLPPLRVFARHLLPNGLTPVLVATSLLVGDAILIESTISFLGLGTLGDAPSWGRMIADGRNELRTAWWISTWPGIALVLVVVGFNLTADGLRDALDPRFRHGVRRGVLGGAGGSRS